MPDVLTRHAAWELLAEWTHSESLRKHAMAVEAAVRGYARRFGEDEEFWGITALLHDFDYERYPSLDDHPFKGSEILRDRLAGKVEMDFGTARRLFTLICALHMKT